MGRAARANQRSFDGKTDARAVLDARLQRFVEASFDSEDAFDGFCDVRGLNDTEREYIRQFLPAHARRPLVKE